MAPEETPLTRTQRIDHAEGEARRMAKKAKGLLSLPHVSEDVEAQCGELRRRTNLRRVRLPHADQSSLSRNGLLGQR